MPISIQGSGGFVQPEQVIERLTIQNGAKIADFGCGAGYFTFPLARRVGNAGVVYAMDVFESVLSSIEARAKASGLFMIKTLRVDLERPNGSTLASEIIDIVLISNILYQAVEKEAIIREAYRILKPGGMAIIMEWNARPGSAGPPLEMRISEDQARSLALNMGFRFQESLPVDAFHYTLSFKK